MKVGVYLDEYKAEDGGGFTMQFELFRALGRLKNETGHKFFIISKPDRALVEESKALGFTWLPDNRDTLIEQIREFFARYWPKFRQRFRWRSSLERNARKLGIEYVWFLGPRPRALDLPYLTIVLDLQHRKQPWFPEVSEYGEWEARERLLAPFLRRAAGIITGTTVGKTEIIQFFQVPESRIHILPHPTPDYVKSHVPEIQLQKWSLHPGFLFYPAQFWAHKNHLNLLLAVKKLSDEGLDIPLVLTGSDFGNMAYVRQQITNLRLERLVKIIGFVTQSELISLYKSALALTYVSYFGPENLPPLEAFALGCPVIAANVDGAEEQFGNTALLVNPDKPDEIADAVRRILVDKELRKQLVDRGKTRAARWSADDFVAGVFSILDQFQSVRQNWPD